VLILSVFRNQIWLVFREMMEEQTTNHKVVINIIGLGKIVITIYKDPRFRESRLNQKGIHESPYIKR
jgi:hypothetical protein